MSENQKNEPRQDQPARNDVRNATRYIVVGFPKMVVLAHSRTTQVGVDVINHPSVIIKAMPYRNDRRQRVVDLASCECLKLDPDKWTVSKVRELFLNSKTFPGGPTYEKAAAKFRSVLKAIDQKPIEFGVPMVMTEEYFLKVVIARELEEVERSKKVASIDLTTALLGAASA